MKAKELKTMAGNWLRGLGEWPVLLSISVDGGRLLGSMYRKRRILSSLISPAAAIIDAPAAPESDSTSSGLTYLFTGPAAHPAGEANDDSVTGQVVSTAAQGSRL